MHELPELRAEAFADDLARYVSRQKAMSGKGGTINRASGRCGRRKGVPLNEVAGLPGGAILSRRRPVRTAAVMLCRKLPFRGAGYRSCPVLQTGRGGGRHVWL